ncbi:MAG: ATP-binding protein [Christensenellaceae bacterium]
MHHILWEIVDNSTTGGNGCADKIKVTLRKDGGAVEDNGRGIPADIHPKRRCRASGRLTNCTQGNSGRAITPIRGLHASAPPSPTHFPSG